MPYKDSTKRKEWYRKRAKTKKYQDYSKKWRLEHKEYFLDWAKNNREKTRAFVKKWRDKNKVYCTKKTIEWYKAHPWIVAFNSAKNRCTNSKCERYNRYGGRGIKFNLTHSEVKKLWDRDNASEMIRPTMDRKNNNGNYEYSNCQFIPMSENVAKSNRERRT
ncbi:MAG: hypothetical protein AABX75_00915 [Nanoarchaeota archaeon]